MLRYAITDRRRPVVNESGAPFIPRSRSAGRDGWGESLVAQAAALAARGDIDFLQLREKDLPPAALAALARNILETLRAHMPDRASPGGPFIPRASRGEWGGVARRPRLLINSRADVALAVRADGVHLTSAPGELTPAQIRALYASAGLPRPIVSLSCHTLAEVVAARITNPARGSNHQPDPAAAPDLILFGPVFEKRITERSSPTSAGQLITEGSGLELLRQACAAASPVPVLALGGITEENTSACLAAGAAGIAAIRMFSH
jgi:thiamine-phosphate pyrophosphorylase